MRKYRTHPRKKRPASRPANVASTPVSILPMAWYPTKEAAPGVGMVGKSLAQLRTTGGGPCYSRLPSGRCLYQGQDLIDWLSSRKAASLAEERARKAGAA